MFQYSQHLQRPGPTPFREVVAIAPEWTRIRKEMRQKNTFVLHSNYKKPGALCNYNNNGIAHGAARPFQTILKSEPATAKEKSRSWFSRSGSSSGYASGLRPDLI